MCLFYKINLVIFTNYKDLVDYMNLFHFTAYNTIDDFYSHII